MIYLKRFLYIFITIMLYALMIPVTILYVVLIPIGLIISFVLTEDFTKYFIPFIKLEECMKFIDDKLEYIFLK